MSTLSRATGTVKPRRKNDFYRTIDRRAVDALLPHVPAATVFAEPCAGAGDLIQLLESAGLVCDWALELEPQDHCLRNRWPIGIGNALQLTRADLGRAAMFITNPPWDRGMLHPIIRHLATIAPIWCLFDTGWKASARAAPFGRLCSDIVPVGRLKWFAGSEHDSTDDCAWYRFAADHRGGTLWHWRQAKRSEGQGQLL